MDETGHGIEAVEVKPGATAASDYSGSIRRVADVLPGIVAKTVVYRGTRHQSRSDREVAPPAGVECVLEGFDIAAR